MTSSSDDFIKLPAVFGRSAILKGEVTMRQSLLVLLFRFFVTRHAMVSASRPLPELMSPRCSIALIVLRLADRGRTPSSSFDRRRTGLPPSERLLNKAPHHPYIEGTAIAHLMSPHL
jgi:hypothetical protein